MINIFSKQEFYKKHNQSIGNKGECFDTTIKIDSYIPRIYHNINGEDVYNTFNYIYNKIQKGIFVKFLENNTFECIHFFSTEKNEWGHLITVPQNLETKSRFNIEKNPNFWQTNNGIMRYEKPHIYHNNNVDIILDMLTELTKHFTLPIGFEFFLNIRDFPIISKEAKFEPYYNIYGFNYPLQHMKVQKLCPVFSFSTSSYYDDILLPNYDDWARVRKLEDNVCLNGSLNDYNFEHVEWNEKYNKAVFRGSNTGPLVNNTRVKLANIKHPLLDVGITKSKNTLQKNGLNIGFSCYPKNLLVKKLSFQEQLKYKIIIHVDGHVSAFRLGLELASRSCLLIVESVWKLWFNLKPFVHFIPIKKDLSDLIEVVEWCFENEDKIKTIADNAYNFYENNLKKINILSFMNNQFWSAAKQAGNYKYHKVKFDTFIFKHVPVFKALSNWLTEDESSYINQTIDIKNIHLNDQINIFFQLIVQLRYLKWHHCAHFPSNNSFKILIVPCTEKEIKFHDLHDHLFLNPKFKTIIYFREINYVYQNYINFWKEKHNFFDVLKFFANPFFKKFNCFKSMNFEEIYNEIYLTFYPLYNKQINYFRKMPQPMIHEILGNINPKSIITFIRTNINLNYEDKLILYRQLQIFDKWLNENELAPIISKLNSLKPKNVSFDLKTFNVDICNPIQLQYNPKRKCFFQDIKNDSIYVRILYELLYSNKFIKSKDKEFYNKLFLPLLNLNKTNYTIEIAKRFTLYKYYLCNQ